MDRDQLTQTIPGSAGGGGAGQRYLLLVAPSSNRVYAGEAARLTAAELAAFGERVLSTALSDPEPVTLGGVRYLGFTTAAPLTTADLAYLSCVSTGYALFAVEGELLRPVPLTPPARYDDDLLTIPKYPGKTNEQFTQLLLNLTVLGSDRAPGMRARRLVVLDPMCGRGTTLHQALRYGYDAIGVERDGGHVDAYEAFLKTWLRRKRLKHRVEVSPVRQDRQWVARRLTATLAPDKEAHRTGDTQRVTVFQADTTAARRLLKPGCGDLVVTDAPYGVAHRSRTEREAPPRRSPLDLLADAVPVWAELLRAGGALGVSFNTHVAGRDAVAALLAKAGLVVADSPPYLGLAHRVDQGITRDLLVARKPTA